jgi:hypothetical protein
MRSSANAELPCWRKPCKTSELQFEQTVPWLAFWSHIFRNERLMNVGSIILKEAGADNAETLEFLALMDSWFNYFQAKKNV